MVEVKYLWGLLAIGILMCVYFYIIAKSHEITITSLRTYIQTLSLERRKHIESKIALEYDLKELTNEFESVNLYVATLEEDLLRVRGMFARKGKEDG